MGMLFISLREKVGPRVYEFGFENYINFFNEPIYWNTLIRTASMSLLVTVLALLIGFPIAYYIAKIAGNRKSQGRTAVALRMFSAMFLPLAGKITLSSTRFDA